MMQGGKQLVNAKAIALILLFFCSIYSMSINKTLEYAEQENNHAQFSDSNSNNHQWNVTAGQWYSIEILCDTCTADLTLNETILFEEARQFIGQVNTSGILQLTIGNHNAQDVEVISLLAPNETFPTIRPSPGEIHPLIEIYDCHQTDSCIDKE